MNVWRRLRGQSRVEKVEEVLTGYLDEHRWDALAGYNQRISQGIVHRPDYVERMGREQAQFDLEQRGRYRVRLGEEAR